MSSNLKVAIVQAAPVFMNLAASLDFAVRLIGEAAAKGAKLVVFGETWLPGYPAWLDYCPTAALWNHEPTKEVYADLRRNSLVLNSSETERLAKAAAENRVALVIGVNERVDEGAGNGTLYNSLLTFNSDGLLINHHRKLKLLCSAPFFVAAKMYTRGGSKAKRRERLAMFFPVGMNGCAVYAKNQKSSALTVNIVA